MPAPVAVLVEVDGEPVPQAYIAYCAICRGPCRGAPPPTAPQERLGAAAPSEPAAKVEKGWHISCPVASSSRLSSAS